MNEQQLQLILQDPQFWSWLSQQTGLPEELCQLMVALMLQSGDQLAQQLFLQIVLQYILAVQGALMARLGMKINYLKTLRGNCPAGTQLRYYKTGGRICKKCVKKHQEGSPVGNPIDQFRSERCGGKMKKKAVGGTVDLPESNTPTKSDFIETPKPKLYPRNIEVDDTVSERDTTLIPNKFIEEIKPEIKFKSKPNKYGLIKRNRFKKGGILKGQNNTKVPHKGVLSSLWEEIKNAAEAAGDWIKGVMNAILIGPSGEIVPVQDVIDSDDSNNSDYLTSNGTLHIPGGYRPISQEEAVAVLNHFADNIAPYYDRTTGYSIGPSSALRVISLYEHMPADTAIIVEPYGGYPLFYNNRTVDLNRRVFDYYNSLFPNDTPKSTTRHTSKLQSTVRRTPASSDTIRFEIVNGRPILVGSDIER